MRWVLGLEEKKEEKIVYFWLDLFYVFIGNIYGEEI